MELVLLFLLGNIGIYLFILYNDGLEGAPNMEQTLLCLSCGILIVFGFFAVYYLIDLRIRYHQYMKTHNDRE